MEHVYRIEKGPKQSTRSLRFPDLVHVWVVGEPGWLKHRLPEPFATLADNEKDDRYRVLVIGRREIDATGFGYGTDVRNVGMRRKRIWP